ncbi:MAG: adenylate/guanylate cyclase domain-containing protein [Actinomycetota bacterium]
MQWECESCGRGNPDENRFCGGCGSRRPTDQAATPHLDERRLITALFADISGFTELADSLDAEDVHEIIAPLIARLARVAERYGGTIAKYAGDALLVFFGAPVAFEDHAARALAVALEMHRECAAALPSLPQRAARLRLHIGVNTGSVVSGRYGGDLASDYSILGDAVNVAQRLESVAPSGETYVGALTAQLCESRFVLEQLAPILVKGKAEPIPAFRLWGAKEAILPSAATIGLVGREQELAALEQVLATASGRIGIIAEAGVGKSALVTALRQSHSEEWLQARCDSYSSSVAYRPFAGLLRRALRLPELPELIDLERALSSQGSAEAAPVFAQLLGISVSQPDPQAFQRALHDAFAAWLRARTQAVLCVEDLHWVDDASLALLEELAGMPGVRVVLTARPEGSASVSKIAPQTIVLEPLARTALNELVEKMLGGTPPDGFVEALSERTQGNPLFVEEIVRSLKGSSKLSMRSGRWVLSSGWNVDGVPPTIEGVIGARIDALPREAQRVLGAAAVAGRLVAVPLLKEVMRIDVDEPLHHLATSGFLDPVPALPEQTYLLHHALVQEVAYNRLLRKSRAELHLRCARATELLYGATDEMIDSLARNYYLAGEKDEAFKYLRLAGERARSLFANESAVQHFERAMEVAPESQLPDLQLALADLLELIGRYADAYETYERVRDATNDVRAWRGMISTLRKRGSYAEAMALVDDALGMAAPDQESEAALYLERAWTLAVEGNFSETLSAAEKGLSLAPEASATKANLLVQLSHAYVARGEPRRALSEATQALKIFERLQDLRGQATTLRLLGAVTISMNDFETAEEFLREGIHTARRIGNIEEVGGCLVNLSFVAEKRGNFGESIELARSAIREFDRIGHVAGSAVAYANLSTPLLRLGRDEEALNAAGQALEIARTINHIPIIADSLQTIATVKQRANDHEGAASNAQEAAELWEAAGVTDRAREAYKIALASLRGKDDARAAFIDARVASLKA